MFDAPDGEAAHRPEYREQHEPPEVGLTFSAVETKKEAEAIATEAKATLNEQVKTNGKTVEKKFTIPIIIKADVAGSAEALENEIRKLESERLTINILKTNVGQITEDDVKMASGAANTLIIGFRVGIEKTAAGLAERYGIGIKTFEIIYEVADWLKEELKNRLPEEIVEKEIGKELDPFDLICHIAYGRKPMTRRERAEEVKKCNYFTK